MNANPEKTTFCRDFCPQHPNNFLEFVCDQEQCGHYLAFQCTDCHQQHISEHKHQCPKTIDYTTKLHAQCLANLTKNINQKMAAFSAKINEEIRLLNETIKQWYSPMAEGTTEKQFVFTAENPSKWDKIQETARFKDELIAKRLDHAFWDLKKKLELSIAEIDVEMKELKYSATPEKWKFDKNFSHQLINISGFNDRTMDKKSDRQKYCVSLLNSPISPFRNEVSFTVNSQHVRDKLLVIGLCEKKLVEKTSFETNLKDGIYAVYQAAKNGVSNNAFSLHCSNQDFHYKQSVGWNFKSGDIITISIDFVNPNKPGTMIVHFMKKGLKDSYEMPINKSEGFLYPFVAMYSSGDKVSIEQSF